MLFLNKGKYISASKYSSIFENELMLILLQI